MSMATRRNKDKEIEELKARNTYLENKNKIFTSWNNMSDRERLILVLLWVVVIILIAFIITLSVTNTTKNPIETKEDYERINSILKDAIGAIVLDMSEFGISKVDMSISNNINLLDELNDYDKDIIISTLKNLGRSDINSQSNIIENAISIVEKQIKEANENKVRSSKVYRTMGVITGLIIVVIFI